MNRIVTFSVFIGLFLMWNLFYAPPAFLSLPAFVPSLLTRSLTYNTLMQEDTSEPHEKTTAL